MLARAGAVPAWAGNEPAPVLERGKGVDVRVAAEKDIATIAAIAAVRPTSRHELLAPPTDNTIATITANDANIYLIYQILNL